MTQEKRDSLGIESMPENLCDAIAKFEEDEFIKNVLGEHISNNYIDAKKKEWQEYRAQVTDWELERYLNRY